MALAQLAMEQYVAPALIGKTSRVVALAPLADAHVLDIAGPMEIFRSATEELRERGSQEERDAYDVIVVGPEKGPMRTSSGLHVIATHGFDDLRRMQIDTLIVAGGATGGACEWDELADFVAQAAPSARRIASFGSGVYVLAQAGLLDARRGTAHWRVCKSIAEQFPGFDDSVVVRDGQIYTSAGAAASLDLGLALVQEDFGHEIATAVASRKILGGRQLQEKLQGKLDASSRPSNGVRIHLLASWIMQEPRLEFSAELLASRAAVSVRTLSRLFVRETGMTPSKFVETIRLRHAQLLMDEGGKSLETVASRSGFGNEERMRRAFHRAFGVSPREYLANRLAEKRARRSGVALASVASRGELRPD